MSLVVLIAAVAENGVIGRDGELPWRLSSDLKRFKADTIGRPVIMGRKTFQAIGRALPGRRNIVVTRDASFSVAGVEAARSLEDALQKARASGDDGIRNDEICVIGGGEIYRQAMPFAGQLKLTHVLAEVDGDTRFPVIEPEEWTSAGCQDHPAGEKDSHATRYCVYERRRPSAMQAG